MYVFLGIFLLIAIVFFFLGWFRARRIRKKVCTLSCCEKNQLLNDLIEPFGFSYDPCSDVFSSRLDAWQKDFGYCTLYDRAAPHVQLVFDCEPFYFNAHGRTWLLELWKGQYGINTGAEMGLYYAEGIIPPEDYTTTLFQAVEESRMPYMTTELWKGDQRLYQQKSRHWWQTGFLMGCFSQPEELTLKANITFDDFDMQEAFLQALEAQNYPWQAYSACYSTITLVFTAPQHRQPCQRAPLSCRFSQWKNKRFCKLFLWITRPFSNSADRLLYLYYFLPFAFRRTVQVCKPKRYKSGRKLRRKQKRM